MFIAQTTAPTSHPTSTARKDTTDMACLNDTLVSPPVDGTKPATSADDVLALGAPSSCSTCRLCGGELSALLLLWLMMMSVDDDVSIAATTTVHDEMSILY